METQRTWLEINEGAEVPLHPEHHGALLCVERVVGEVVLAQELRVVDPGGGQRVLPPLVDVGVVQAVQLADDELPLAGDRDEGGGVVQGRVLLGRVVED